MNRSACLRLASLVLAVLTARSAAAAAVDPARDARGWLEALDGVTVGPEGWTIARLELELGSARLEIERGTLVPVRGPAAAGFEYLFFGEARFVLSTDDPVESYQIELFTGREQLDEPVTRAVLAIASDDVALQLSRRPGARALTDDERRAARALFSDWRDSREYLRSDLRLRALQDAVSDPDAERFAAAWCDAPRLGRFLYRFDPYADDRTRLEQFVPLRMGDLDKETWRKHLRREQSEGRFLGVDPDDLGSWDVWYAGAPRTATGERLPGHSAFEAERYALEVRVDDDIVSIAARATIDLVARTEGARAVEISLFRDLVVDSITLPGGAALPWARSTDNVIAVLPAPLAAGATCSIEVRYHGVLFDRDESKRLVKRSTVSWYPHVGSVDRATYRATYEMPARWSLLGSGTVREEYVTGAVRRQVRQLDEPSAFFGFELGRFDLAERTLGHVKVTVGFLNDPRRPSDAERDALFTTIRDALETYEGAFGPYPLDALTVATAQHEFAQGFLGFVTLPQSLILDVDGSDARGLLRRRTIAHELAHQWWGNMVGCAADRDAWLSESLAGYAAVLYSRRTLPAADASSSSAYLELVDRTETLPFTLVERPVEAMGPIALGTRLDSSRSDKAYEAVIYQKGPRVLAMLAERLGEEPFLAMLKEIAQRARFRPLDTDTVLAALAKMSGRDLDSFARSFVRGVGYPEIHFEFVSEPKDGGFLVHGTIHQVPRGYRHDRLVTGPDGRFDVVPSFHEYQAVEDSRILVPAVVSIDERAAASKERHAFGFKPVALQGFKTSIEVAGSETPFSVTVPSRPKAMHLDVHGMLPTTIYNGTLEPRRSLVAWAQALRSSGRADEARVVYRKALATPPDDPPDRPEEARWRADLADGLIHVALAEMAIDELRIDEAAAELQDRTVGLLKQANGWAVFRCNVLRARIAMHAGEAATAYKLLHGALTLDVMQKENDTIIQDIHRNALRSGTAGYARDYLVYAAAAHVTGHEDVCREAAAEARRRGGDSSALDALHGAGS